MEFEIRHLTLDEIEELHELALEEYGGLPGRDPNKLEGFIPMPEAGFGDFEQYPTIQEKAAVYLYYLAIGHYFRDGNKRTAYLAAFTFLDFNGADLVATDDDVFETVMSIADNKTRPPFDDIVYWIAKHIQIQQDEDQEEYPVVENP